MYLVLLLEQQLLLNYSLCFSAIAFAAFKLQFLECTLLQSTFTLLKLPALWSVTIMFYCHAV